MLTIVLAYSKAIRAIRKSSLETLNVGSGHLVSPKLSDRASRAAARMLRTSCSGWRESFNISAIDSLLIGHFTPGFACAQKCSASLMMSAAVRFERGKIQHSSDAALSLNWRSNESLGGSSFTSTSASVLATDTSTTTEFADLYSDWSFSAMFRRSGGSSAQKPKTTGFAPTPICLSKLSKTARKFA